MKGHDLSPPSPLEDEDVYILTIWSVENWGLGFRLFGVRKMGFRDVYILTIWSVENWGLGFRLFGVREMGFRV